jgi:hypothetical protein
MSRGVDEVLALFFVIAVFLVLLFGGISTFPHFKAGVAIFAVVWFFASIYRIWRS